MCSNSFADEYFLPMRITIFIVFTSSSIIHKTFGLYTLLIPKMSASIFFYIALLFHHLSPAIVSVSGFQTTRRTREVPRLTDHRGRTREHGIDPCPLSATISVVDDDLYDEKLIAAASSKLDWEIMEETSQKPILNLSLREVSPEETQICTDEVDDDALEWNRGQRWTATVEYLSELGVISKEESSSASESSTPSSTTSSSSILLRECPQLFRLDPSDIQETARWVIDEFGLAYLKAAVLRDGNSILLSFRKEDAAYGLEFMSMMMMTDAKTACAASSAFMLEAVRGGIQERAVSAALGAAGDAASTASRSIASDTMESFRQLRDANRNKK